MHPVPIHHPPPPARPWLPRFSLYNKLLGACPPASLPTRQESGHILKLVLSCLASKGCTWTCASSHRVALARVSCGGMTRVFAVRTSGTCPSACVPHSPARPSPAQRPAQPTFFLPLHIPNYASLSKLCILASDHPSHQPGVRTGIGPWALAKIQCFSAPSPSGGAAVSPALPARLPAWLPGTYSVVMQVYSPPVLLYPVSREASIDLLVWFM